MYACMYVYIFNMGEHAHMVQVQLETRGGGQVPWNWSYRQLPPRMELAMALVVPNGSHFTLLLLQVLLRIYAPGGTVERYQ